MSYKVFCGFYITLYADKEGNELHDVRIETFPEMSEKEVLEIEVLPHGGFVLDID